MEHGDNHRPLWKELAIVITIGAFLLFLVVGGLAWQHGYFEGTIMGQLFVSMILGFLFAVVTALILSKTYKYAWPIWLVSAILVFAAVVVADMLGERRIGSFAALVLDVILGILRIIRWLIRRIGRRP